MNAKSFCLQPFPSAGAASDLEITGSIARHSGTLAIRYSVHGFPAEAMVPAPAETPVRKHGLWQETCFEFFVAVKNAPHYWEFNLSPVGHWNVYRFAGYRQGMEEELAFTALPFDFWNQPGAFGLTLECSLDRIIPVEQPLEVAISTVIKSSDGEVTCWALIHPGPQPDFHRRDSFILQWAGVTEGSNGPTLTAANQSPQRAQRTMRKQGLREIS